MSERTKFSKDTEANVERKKKKTPKLCGKEKRRTEKTSSNPMNKLDEDKFYYLCIYRI